VSIWANTAKEELDAADSLDLFLIFNAFCFQVLGLSVKNMDIVWIDVDMRKEVFVHECMIALRMIARQTDIFVHVESYNIGERDAIIVVRLNEVLIDYLGTGASGKTQNEWPIWSWVEGINATFEILSG
jgi:hypothetical protein